MLHTFIHFAHLMHPSITTHPSIPSTIYIHQHPPTHTFIYTECPGSPRSPVGLQRRVGRRAVERRSPCRPRPCHVRAAEHVGCPVCSASPLSTTVARASSSSPVEVKRRTERHRRIRTVLQRCSHRRSAFRDRTPRVPSHIQLKLFTQHRAPAPHTCAILDSTRSFSAPTPVSYRHTASSRQRCTPKRSRDQRTAGHLSRDHLYRRPSARLRCAVHPRASPNISPLSRC